MSTKVQGTVLVMAVACALGGLAFQGAYPGFVEDMLAEVRHATPTEMRHDLGFVRYNVEYFQRLQRDPATDRVDFSAAVPPDDPFERGKLSYHLGDFPGAIHDLEQAVEQGSTESKLLWLALAHLRQAEQVGCHAELHRPQTDSAHPARQARFCSLPAAAPAGARHDLQRAAGLFEDLLERHSPSDAPDPLHRWLLNFTHMVLGDFPDGVPTDYRIDSDFVDTYYGQRRRDAETRHAHLRFEDRAHALGVAVDDAGKGVAVEDFDGDGFLDLVTGGSFETVRFFANVPAPDGGRTFEDRTAAMGLDGVLQPFIITAADYDNDGWMDLFVGRPYHVFTLLRNVEGSGGRRFVDVTREAGLLDTVEPHQSVFTFVSAWADVDLDGDLDLFLAQLGRRLPFGRGLLGKEPMPSTLFLNDGGHFHDATDAFGLRSIVHDRIFTGAAFGDYDNDGSDDLFLSSFTRGVSVLLRNVDGQTFESTRLIQNTNPGFMASFIDIDHDGRLDLFQGATGPGRSIVDGVVFGTFQNRYANTFHHQTPEGTFENRPELFDGGIPIGSMGAAFGDLDNDGCHDFYLGTGNSEPFFVLPNLMARGLAEGNGCSGRLENLSMLHGFGSIQKGHGIVFFDFDDDGDQDIYSSLGGMWPADPWPNQLFVNGSQLDHAWVKLRLRGRRANRSGIGARLTVFARDAQGEPMVRHWRMGNGTGFGSAPYLAHIGLGHATDIDRVEVRWPGSQTIQTYDVALRATQTLEEAIP